MNINIDFVRIISTVIVFLMFPIVRMFTYKLVNNFAGLHAYNEGRVKMIKKTLNILILLVVFTILISIWGVDPKNLLVALSSVFAVIGVALFAQWSILSNVTAGLIIFFTLKLKIGDRIKIHDKDLPIEATLEDIRTFYVFLVTDDGERIAYPNNLILQKGISICSNHSIEE